MRDFKKAEKFQKEAIRLIRDDEKHRNYNYLAQVYTRSGDFQKAKDCLNKVENLLD